MKVEVNIKNIAWLLVRLIISVLFRLVCKAFGGREIIVMLTRSEIPRGRADQSDNNQKTIYTNVH